MQISTTIFGRFIAPWIVVFTIVGYPIVTAISSIFDLPNRPVSIIARSVVLVLSMSCIIFAHNKPYKKVNFGFWLSWWIFWLAYLTRLLVDHSLNYEALLLPTTEYLIFILGVCLLPSMAAMYLEPRTVTLTVLDKVIWIAAIGLLLNLNYIFSTTVQLDALDTIRAESDVLNPITIGHIGVTILLLVFWKLSRDRTISIVKAIPQLVAAIIAVYAILSSGSKGPLLALFLSIIFYAMMFPRRFLKPRILAWILVFAIATALFVGVNPDFFIFSRISDGVFNDGIRSKLLLDSVDLILKHPVLGSGIEPLGIYPHNLLVESFLLFGIATGLPFLFMTAFTFWRCRSIARRRPEDFWICLLFSQYFFGAMVSGSLYTSAALYTIMVMVVAIGASWEPSMNTKPSRSPASSLV